jgi:hypothetical protein
MHQEVIISKARKIFDKLDHFPNFYLAGGTGIKILPTLEIAAMKAYALGRRATLKDYIDLYFVLKGKINSLEEIITFCEKKYSSEFDPRLFLEQLIYLKDVEKIEIQFSKEKISIPEMEKFFEGEVKKINLFY